MNSSDVLSNLESSVPGLIDTRSITRYSNSHDASHYLLTPEVVAAPKNVKELSQLFAACAATEMSMTFRSGGTSLSGQSITNGMLVDTRRHFRQIEVLENGNKVRVQPGATVRSVNARLAQYKRKLGPDPASEIACTIGGVVANNSSGMACGTEFNSYNTLDSLVLVLSSGTTIDTSESDANNKLRLQEPALFEGLIRLRDRIRGNANSVVKIENLFSIKNTMGYGLNSFVDFYEPIDILAHLMVGSEGTLGFVASATFQTIPIKSHAATGFLLFENLNEATASLPELVNFGFATIELLDATSLKVGQRDRQANAFLRSLQVKEHAALLVEIQEDLLEGLASKLSASSSLFHRLPIIGEPSLSQDMKVRNGLWHIRKGLYASVAGNRPTGTTALLEDIAVPVPALLDTCQNLIELFRKFDYQESVIFGHAKDGNIHFMLNEQFERPEKLERYLAFTDEMVELVLGNSGTLKAEHGTGRIMAPFVRRQYGDELYEVMLEIKRLCDPQGILNAGILLNEDAKAFVSNLKIEPQVELEVDRCVECGFCEPICPSKDLTLTPRQRIVIRREIEKARKAGDLSLVKELARDYEYSGLHTCAVDGMCQTSCPVDINTGDLVRRLRSEEVSKFGDLAWKFSANHWGVFSKLGGFALTSAKALPVKPVRFLVAGVRQLIGNDSIPQWESDLPSGGTHRTPRANTRAEFLYFPSCTNALFGPGEAGLGVQEAFQSLCNRAGVEMVIPSGIGDLCCATPWKSKGHKSGYLEMQEKVTNALLASNGAGKLPIVSDATSCSEGLEQLIASAGLTHEQVRIVDVVDFVLTEILPKLLRSHQLESIVIHPTCSSTRLGTNSSLVAIAEYCAAEVVVPSEWGCCAFAGDRGMLHPELSKSATRLEAEEISKREFSAYASVNRTCEIGMSRATGKSYRHIIEILEEVTR